MQDCVLGLARLLERRQVDFVLQPWTTDEAKLLPFAVDKAAQASLSFVDDGASNAMNTFNGNALDPS